MEVSSVVIWRRARRASDAHCCADRRSGRALAIRRDEAALATLRRSPADRSRGACSARSRIRPLPPPSPRLEGWALRRGLLVHGLKTPIDYLRLTADYATERPEAIRCPTLICSAENDELGATARDLYAGSPAARPFWPSRHPRVPANIANPARAPGSTNASSIGSTRRLPISPRTTAIRER